MPGRGVLVLLLLLARLATSAPRDSACTVMMAADQTALALFNNSYALVRRAAQDYVSGLNQIFQRSILANPPNHRLHFQLAELRILSNFLPGCGRAGSRIPPVPPLNPNSVITADKISSLLG